MASQNRIEDILIERNVPVVMRDGVKLYADIYRPDTADRYPVLLIRTPYNKEDAQTMNYAHPAWYARHDYVVIAQDTRGRWSSEGDFHPYDHEAEDGYDTVEWAAALPFALPRVGMYGFSYVGAAQLLTAAAHPPALTCIVPAMIGSDAYQGKVYRNGAFALACNLSWVLFVSQDTALRQGRGEWASEISARYAAATALYKHLPLTETPGIIGELAPYYKEWLDHPLRDDYWRKHSIKEQYDQIGVPALHLAGWYDIFLDGTIENFGGLRQLASSSEAREHQYLIVEPWFHMPWSRYVGELDFGSEADNRIDQLQLRWFDRWLKGKEASWDGVAPVQYFLMGANRWEQSPQWPPADAVQVPYYLHSKERANSINGDGSLSPEPPLQEQPDLFVYHPSIPVPALGGRSGAVPDLTPMGPKNQLPIEIRNDVLVYTSAPLAEDTVIAGEIKVVLYAATSTEDTDFVAKLVDVYPDGSAYNIAEGIIRASCRNSLEKQEAVEPWKVIRYEISLGSTAILLKKGHAIRLDVTSSLFPTFDRNPNRILPPGEVREADFRTATQTVYHDERYPSHILLPVSSSATT
ncbi:CocE/NonD family hydrolase [Paenibacillus sp. GCM10012307]|uniref:CocE/NonD family hydrolase n=1 Tax=Paenibacillus roseus TaxID=2798579 RepID=A0A934MNR8_9BACL|nr:CocE/NonD family hydrolase [Paenibacillus roseus]MBJ6360113.1 CocE/NonD family hydrolase [Paenibacillus roseus]